MSIRTQARNASCSPRVFPLPIISSCLHYRYTMKINTKPLNFCGKIDGKLLIFLHKWSRSTTPQRNSRLTCTYQTFNMQPASLLVPKHTDVWPATQRLLPNNIMPARTLCMETAELKGGTIELTCVVIRYLQGDHKVELHSHLSVCMVHFPNQLINVTSLH
jgi:hypothetical protein